MLRRALEAAQNELLEFRTDPKKRKKKGKGRSKRRWFGWRHSSSASLKSRTSSHALLGAGHGRGASTGSGVAGVGGDDHVLRADEAEMVDPRARRYTRAQYKHLRTALAAPTLQSCGSPLRVPQLLARVLVHLPFEEVRLLFVVACVYQHRHSLTRMPPDFPRLPSL